MATKVRVVSTLAGLTSTQNTKANLTDGQIIRVAADGGEWKWDAASTATASAIVKAHDDGGTGRFVRQLGDVVSITEFLTPAELADVTGRTASLDVSAAFAAALAVGNYIEVPHGKYRIASAVTVSAGKALVGQKRGWARFTGGLGTPAVSEIFADETNGIICDDGFAYLGDLQVTGTTGEYVGIDLQGPDVSTDNIAVYGFNDGAALRLDFSFRASHSNLNLQGCGIGVWFDGVVNSTTFINATIENNAVGVYGTGTMHGILWIGGTIEGNEKGKFTPATAFPTTGLLTASAQFLTDLGVTQANLEGGYIVSGQDGGFLGTYFEKNSLCHIYAGLGCVLSVLAGCYFEDKVPLIGDNQVSPTYFIDGRRARALTVENIYISTENARGSALFNIDTHRYHRIENNRYIASGGVYTGDVYANTQGALRYSTNTILRTAANVLIAHRTQTQFIGTNAVSSTSGTLTINVDIGSVFFAELTENTTIALSNVANANNGQLLEILVKQDGTGGWTLSFPGTMNVSWSETGNVAAAVSSVQFRYRSADTTWYQVGAQRAYA